MLLTGFESFCHNSHQAQQMQRALHAQRRLFMQWRRSVQSRVADWMQGPCRATVRRRLHLKGWQSEQQWHDQYTTHRCMLLLLKLMIRRQSCSFGAGASVRQWHAQYMAHSCILLFLSSHFSTSVLAACVLVHHSGSGMVMAHAVVPRCFIAKGC